MAVFDNHDPSRLHIHRMHFHIVGPPTKPDSSPIFTELGEVDHRGFEDFFLARVIESSYGNRFHFSTKSRTLDSLRKLLNGQSNIQKVSAELAQQFATYHTRQMSVGVFMLIDLFCDNQAFHALLKFDDKEVLGYRRENTKTVLKRLERTFVEDKNAMQKVAIARMSLGVPQPPVLVLERSNRKVGTEYFRNFLGIDRVYDNSELTKILDRVVQQTKSDLTGQVDAKRLRDAVSRARHYMLEGDGFDEDICNDFITYVFGPDTDGTVINTFKECLTRSGIAGESFQFDKKAVERPRMRRLRTVEDIEVTYAKHMEHLVEILDNGQILIKTEGVKDRDDYSK
jgi:hypothetical protein